MKTQFHVQVAFLLSLGLTSLTACSDSGDDTQASPASAEGAVAPDSPTPAEKNETAPGSDKGDAVPENAGNAAELYRKAAEQGDAEAQFQLAICYA